MKKIVLFSILSSFLLFFISATENKKANTAIVSPDILPTINQQIDDILRDEMIKQEIVGIAVGVVKDGAIIYNTAKGYSNREKKTAMTTKTPLRWASISKTLTAVAAMQLIEDGKLNLNDKVSKYLSETEWPRTTNTADKIVGNKTIKKEDFNKGDITVAQLLSHRSGINHYGKGKNSTTYKNNAYAGSKTSYDSAASIAIFKDTDLDFVPGSNYLYTTYGFSLLAAVVEKASPKGYLKWIDDKVKTPLDLKSLQPSYNKFEGYITTCKGVSPFLENGKYDRLAGGGWLSNSEDLTKFMKGIMDEKLVSKASLTQMKSNISNSYGYGMEINSYCGTFYGHGGTHENMLTMMYFTNDQKLGIVLMINGKIESRERIFSRIAKAMGKPCNISTNLKIKDCDKAIDCNDNIAITWRKSTDNVLIRRGYTYPEFKKVSDELKTIGFHPIDIETYLNGSTRYWDGLFKKEATKSEIVTDLDLDAFNTKWNELSNKGFRLIDIETYKTGSKARQWSGVFVNGSGKHALFRNFETTDFGNKRDELTKQGYKLIDIEAYEDDGELYWAGVWTEGNDGLLNRNMTDSQFSAKHKDWESKGYRIIDVETYIFKNKRYWAGIWEKSTENQKINRNLNYCKILDKNSIWEKEGYEMQDLEIY